MHPTGNTNLLHVSFNQDSSCFVCGTNNGFFVCNSNPFKERFRREFDGGGIGIVEYLNRTNILALVGGGKTPQYPTNRVMIWDDHQVQCIADLSFNSEVKAVRLRKDRIVVVLLTKVYIYDFTDLNLVDQIDTSANPLGLCAVSSGKDMVMASLGEKPGEVRVDHYAKNEISIVPAHLSTVSAIAMNAQGTRLATTSEKGTLVRVFDISTAKPQLLEELRRGTQQVEIHSLAFNAAGTILCCSSTSRTIHIMAVGDALDNKTSSFSSWKGYIPFAGDTWSARQIKLEDEAQCLCAFPAEEGVIIILGSSGKYYRYSFSSQDQECHKVSEQTFFTGSLQ